MVLHLLFGWLKSKIFSLFVFSCLHHNLSENFRFIFPPFGFIPCSFISCCNHAVYFQSNSHFLAPALLRAQCNVINSNKKCSRAAIFYVNVWSERARNWKYWKLLEKKVGILVCEEAQLLAQSIQFSKYKNGYSEQWFTEKRIHRLFKKKAECLPFCRLWAGCLAAVPSNDFNVFRHTISVWKLFCSPSNIFENFQYIS